jgi:hypothetical protein
MPLTHDTKIWFASSSRGRRLAVYTAVVIITIVILVPAWIMGIGHLAGFDACYMPDAPAVPGICSPQGRLVFTIVGIAITIPLLRAWVRFLARRLAITKPDARQ